MSSKTISAENLGPISALEFALTSPGVTVLVAPNGSGKTILLEAVQAAARGEGKLPLRDKTKRGKVEAFGAVVTIGGTCRHTGAFEVTNLEGRFDLAALVDPRIKAPALADKARIKALVSLTGVQPDANLFRKHEAFEDFGTVVLAGSLETDDLCDMAAKIKDDYDRAALLQERQADNQHGQASALLPPNDLDMDAESDSVVLQKSYDEARDAMTRLNEQAAAAIRDSKRANEAKALLETLEHDELVAERAKLTHLIQESNDAVVRNTKEIDDLRKQAMVLKQRNETLAETSTTAAAKLEGLTRQIELVQQATGLVTLVVTEAPTADQITEAETRLTEARANVERGTLIRNARKDADKAAQHRAAAKAAKDRAGKYRDAGKATDEVLSGCIQCAQLRIESDGKSARLVADTDRGKSIPFHDLSDGEKWTTAIDIGADQVGEGGLLVISQVGWEGIDGLNRNQIHAHAVHRGVYILTAEAATDPKAKKEIKPLGFAEAETEQIAGQQVAKAMAADIPPKPVTTTVAKEPAKEPAAKPEPKPKPVAKAAELSDYVPW